jgi:hypothetical protein
MRQGVANGRVDTDPEDLGRRDRTVAVRMESMQKGERVLARIRRHPGSRTPDFRSPQTFPPRKARSEAMPSSAQNESHKYKHQVRGSYARHCPDFDAAGNRGYLCPRSLR